MVQANLVLLDNDADGAFARTAQAKFRVAGNELGQIVDAPMGLTSTGLVDLARLLTGQDQQACLDVSRVQPSWWTLWAVFEAVQPLFGEAVAPEPDGAFGQNP